MIFTGAPSPSNDVGETGCPSCTVRDLRPMDPKAPRSEIPPSAAPPQATVGAWRNARTQALRTQRRSSAPRSEMVWRKEAAGDHNEHRAHPRKAARDRDAGSTVRLAHRAADLPPQERSDAGPAPPPALRAQHTHWRGHRAGARWLLQFSGFHPSNRYRGSQVTTPMRARPQSRDQRPSRWLAVAPTNRCSASSLAEPGRTQSWRRAMSIRSS